MALLNDLWIFHTTSETEQSQTNEMFNLVITCAGIETIIQFPNLNHNEREKGRTDEYHFDLRTKGINDQNAIELRMEITGPNGWLPKSIWAVSLDDLGEFKVLAHNPDWPQTSKFSTQGTASRRIN